MCFLTRVSSRRRREVQIQTPRCNIPIIGCVLIGTQSTIITTITLTCHCLQYDVHSYWYPLLLLLVYVIIHIIPMRGADSDAEVQHGHRKGSNGVSTNGVTAIVYAFWQRYLLGTNLSKSVNCAQVPLSPIRQNLYVCSDPIRVDPICPQGDKWGQH